MTNSVQLSPALPASPPVLAGSENENRRTTTPYHALDSWRGVACLWVVTYHVAVALSLIYPSLRHALIYALSLVGSLGVQMFFVISGYCIIASASSSLRREQSFSHFVRARVRRIYPPMWFALLLAAAVSLLASYLVSTGRLGPSASAQHALLHQPLSFFVSNLTLTQIPVGQEFLLLQCWTLCYEILFYAIVSVLLLFARRLQTERTLIVVMHLVTLASLGVLIAAPQLRFYPFDLWPQFGLGIVAYDVLKYPRLTAPKWWGGLIALAVVALIAFRDIPLSFMQVSSRSTYALSLVFALVVVGLYRFDGPLSHWRVTRLLAWVGSISYSLYLTHGFVIGIVMQVYRKLHLPQAAHLLAFGVTVAGAVLFARLFYQFCEHPFVPTGRMHPRPTPEQFEH